MNSVSESSQGARHQLMNCFILRSQWSEGDQKTKALLQVNMAVGKQLLFLANFITEPSHSHGNPPVFIACPERDRIPVGL